jgi:hypothetical protein
MHLITENDKLKIWASLDAEMTSIYLETWTTTKQLSKRAKEIKELGIHDKLCSFITRLNTTYELFYFRVNKVTRLALESTYSTLSSNATIDNLISSHSKLEAIISTNKLLSKYSAIILHQDFTYMTLLEHYKRSNKKAYEAYKAKKAKEAKEAKEDKTEAELEAEIEKDLKIMLQKQRIIKLNGASLLSLPNDTRIRAKLPPSYSPRRTLSGIARIYGTFNTKHLVNKTITINGKVIKITRHDTRGLITNLRIKHDDTYSRFIGKYKNLSNGDVMHSRHDLIKANEVMRIYTSLPLIKDKTNNELRHNANLTHIARKIHSHIKKHKLDYLDMLTEKHIKEIVRESLELGYGLKLN